MKIVIAMDSFKGSLTSMEAGKAVAQGIQQVDPDSQIQICPLADGGEGTVEALSMGPGGHLENVRVRGPLGDEVDCCYGILEGKHFNGGTEAGATAVIEMAAAAGLPLVPPEKRNPLHTSTWGVGQIIRHALGKGCRRFLIGLGGSATNDGGAGMLQALGFGLLNSQGEEIGPGALGLKEVSAIRTDHVFPELADCTFRAACDVENVLCGEQGCSAVFAPQKGADPEMVRQMDQWLGRYAALVKETFPRADSAMPGAGAAGGMGFAISACLGGKLEPGVKIVLEETGIEEYLKEADLIFTGEGRIDSQTAMGKAPAGLAALAKKYQKPVVALGGSVEEKLETWQPENFDAVFPVLRRIVTLEEAMEKERAERNLKETAAQVYKLWLVARGK